MNDNFQNLSIEELHKQNQTLWTALVAGVTLFAGLTIWLSSSDTYLDFFNLNEFLTSIFMPIAIGVTVISFFAANFVIKKRLETSNFNSLKEKFVDFRQNFILKACLHEGPALMCTVFQLLESNFYFLLLALFNLILLLRARPTLEKFKSWYQPTNEEYKALRAAFPTKTI